MKKACVYPEGLPSRREFLEMEARQQARQTRQQGNDEIDVDEGNAMKRTNGRDRGQEFLSHAQPQSLPPYASLRGGDNQHLTSTHPSPYGSASNAFTLSAGTIPVATQVRPYSERIDSSRAEGQHLPQQLQVVQRSTSSVDINGGNRTARSYNSGRSSLALDGVLSSDPPPLPDTAQDMSQRARSQGSTTIVQALDAGMTFPSHLSHWPRDKC